MGGVNVKVIAGVLVVAIVAMSSGQSNANWCVCKSSMPQETLQKTLDYACGAGADCNPIHSSGSCFNPNTVLAHCNYAVNSFYQRKLQAQGTCDFAGAATVTASDPTTSSTCSYPSSASSTSTNTNTGTVPVSSSTGTVPVSGTNTPTTPYSTTTTPNGILGGMAPSGTNFDDSSSTTLSLSSFLILTTTLALFSA